VAVSKAISIRGAFPQSGWQGSSGVSTVNDANERFKRAKAPRKSGSVKRVTLSDDAKKKYEDLVRVRDEREQAYGQHLAEERKTKR